MQLIQHYDEPGVPVRLPGSAFDVVRPYLRHKERFLGLLESLDDAAWSAPTRCASWDVADLVRHLISVDQFWIFTLTSARSGEATRLLEGFDPQTTPSGFLGSMASHGPAELRSRQRATHEELVAAIGAFETESDWETPAEIPAGRAPAGYALHHALFDSWVHERDVLLARGESPPVHDDEVRPLVRYLVGAAGLASAGAFAVDLEGPDAFAVELRDPETTVSASIVDGLVTVTEGERPDGVPTATGSCVEVLDAMTGRVPAEAIEGDEVARRGLLLLARALQ